MRNPTIDEFADACYDTNTAEQLQAALEAPQDSLDGDCISDCRQWGRDGWEWREEIQEALCRLQAR